MLVVTGEFNFFASMVFKRGQFRRVKRRRRGAMFLLLEKLLSPRNFIKQSERGAAGFFDRLVAARQTERTQMGDAFDAFVRDEEKFAAPNRAVQAVTGAIPRNAERGRRDFIFRHAGQDVGDVMLDADHGRARVRLRVVGAGSGQPGPTGVPFANFVER